MTKLDGLRVLRKDAHALKLVASLKHDPLLIAWNDGYDAHGTWDSELAAAALAAACTSRSGRTTNEQGWGLLGAPPEMLL